MGFEIPTPAPILPKAPLLNPGLEAHARIGNIGTMLTSLLPHVAVLGLTIAAFRTMLGFPPKRLENLLQSKH